jgi:hypothetical protein
VDAERLRLDADEQAANAVNVLHSVAVRRSLLRDLKAIRMAWTSATPEEQRAIVGELCSEVHIAKGRDPRFVWRSAEEMAVDRV